MTSAIDLAFIRAQFPAFDVPELADRPFMENAGGSYMCRQVRDRLFRFHTERKMQPYAVYSPSKDGGDEMDEARNRMAAILGVATDELSFGPSTTQNVYVLANAFGEMLKDGDAIVVTNQDHEANSGAWRRLEQRGIEVREWALRPETGLLDVEDLAGLLDEKVKLVAFPHCSNVVAAINPVREITQMAKDAGAYVCIDGVSFAPHGFPDVGSIGCDIYLFSSYKTFGPHQGLMVIRRELATRLPNQAHHFNAGDLTKKFTPAGPDHAQIAACAGMADYVDAVFDHHAGKGKSATALDRSAFVNAMFAKQEQDLMGPLIDYLSNSNKVRLLGPTAPDERAPTLALHHERRGADLCKAMAEHGIMAGGDNFYAVRPLEALGIDPSHGVLRLSFLHYTSRGEIAKTIDALDRVL